MRDKKTIQTRPGKRKNTSMYSLKEVNKLVSCGRDPARSLPLWRGFLLIPLILVWLAFAPNAQTTPDPGAVGGSLNTADGTNALVSAVTASGNGAFGWFSLAQCFTGSFNTGVGAGTLVLNHADANTAVGTAALILNVDGTRNTACGAAAMVNTAGDDVTGEGSFNSAVGAFALNANETGFSNNAMGDSAMFRNVNGAANTAVGDLALENNDATGAGEANFNVAVGAQALQANVTGDSNNAVGASALLANDGGLFNQAFGAFALSANEEGASNIAIGDSALANNGTGSFNTVIGDLAGPDITDGGDNIYIGAGAGTEVGNESQTIRIGEPGFIAACFIQGISGVGVSGDTVVVDADGQLGTAAAGSPLSLKEVLKQRQVVQQLKATTEKQAARIALQENQIQTLTAALKQQAEQIQKVSAQLEMIRPTPRVVENR
jgi:dihydroneopterin aldolase